MARRPWIHWLLVAVLAAAVALPVSAAMEDLRRRRDDWGERTTVWVTTRSIEPGGSLTEAVEARDYPRAVVPPGALHELTGAAIAVQRIGTGEIVVDADVAPADGPLALLPAGWLAVTIEVPAGTVGTAAVGDRAVVLAAGAVAAADAVILQVGADALIVGVPFATAPAVAEAAGQRLAVVALAGPLSASRPPR